MADSTIVCPHCSQHISAPEEVLGQMVECPSCNKEFLAAAEGLNQAAPNLDLSSSTDPAGQDQESTGEASSSGQSELIQSHESDSGSAESKQKFSISGWQLLLAYFAIRAVAPHLFDDYEEVLKFVGCAVLAAGVAFFVWKRIISESYIEGGDPKGIQVKSENLSLAFALVTTAVITILINMIWWRGDQDIDLDFFTEEVLYLLISVVAVFYITLLIVRIHNKNMLGQGIKVSRDQIPELYDLNLKVAERLQIQPPQVFIIENDEFNAYALGFKRNYAVVVNSRLLEVMSQEELAFILGHEYTHIKFRHTLWSTLIGDAGASIPILSWLLSLPFLKWSRDAEYTCDRGGLVACGNKEHAISALLLLMGGEKLGRTLSLESIKKQAAEFEKGGIFRNPEAFSTHPFTVNRLVKIESCELISGPES